jgi:hypothetical protein
MVISLLMYNRIDFIVVVVILGIVPQNLSCKAVRYQRWSLKKKGGS